MAIMYNQSEIANSSQPTSAYNASADVTTSYLFCPGCSNATEDGSSSSSGSGSSGSTVFRDNSSPDAFLYFVVVLTFYAVAMTVLMVKYVRRENQEAQLSYYFHEFINRDKFNTPQYRNKQRVRAIKKTLTKFYQSVRMSDVDSKPAAAAAAAAGKDSDCLSKNSSGGSSYFYSDSGVVSDRMAQDTSDLGSSREASDAENCHSDNELLNKDEAGVVRTQNAASIKGENDGRLLKELQMRESAV